MYMQPATPCDAHPGAERRAGEAIAAVRTHPVDNNPNPKPDPKPNPNPNPNQVRTHPVDLDGASFRHFAATREVRSGTRASLDTSIGRRQPH